ncbi:Spo11/DNA topoisomerase VI subunit A [Apodospora peruviana]|uniref:DNA topoisomerase (ATP-hydrolyzing) n=1 Tax=Apodospora peruviana TaxID=516989 RepID=A0AAE0IJ03_9PEZI|nr:Spo11/DNA topoisomerase VI subunit A [Apodospora peruviana]
MPAHSHLLLEALFRILELVHEALLSGNLITKRFDIVWCLISQMIMHNTLEDQADFVAHRNIYYQNIELFKSQSMVDNMVDNLALTLGVGRGDLNIVATAKGLIAGSVDLKMRNGSITRCGLSRDNGMLLPSINSVEAIDLHSAKWLLVIEKEATFRTLAASRFHSTCKTGHGVLITAKGFPDLATRRFLHVLHSVRPQLEFFGLVDFDPHGISILRTYTKGSRRLEHEQGITVPRMRWLGIRSGDVLPYTPNVDSTTETFQDSQSSDSQASQTISSQESASYSFAGGQYFCLEQSCEFDNEGRPPKRARVHEPDSSDSSGSIILLTSSDRRRAVNLMKELRNTLETTDGSDADQMYELQRMMMLNIKAEIQAVDAFGDVTGWLDERLCTHFSA